MEQRRVCDICHGHGAEAGTNHTGSCKCCGGTGWLGPLPPTFNDQTAIRWQKQRIAELEAQLAEAKAKRGCVCAWDDVGLYSMCQLHKEAMEGYAEGVAEHYKQERDAARAEAKSLHAILENVMNQVRSNYRVQGGGDVDQSNGVAGYSRLYHTIKNGLAALAQQPEPQEKGDV